VLPRILRKGRRSDTRLKQREGLNRENKEREGQRKPSWLVARLRERKLQRREQDDEAG
jgi:hypothetical protein